MRSKLSTEECQELLGIKYDAQQKKIHDLIEDNKKKHQKNIQLYAELNSLVKKSKQNITLINQLGQYHRSSYMV